MKLTSHFKIEHRMIEEMLAVIQQEIDRIETQKDVDELFISRIIDFMITYGEQTHHMKEETILFNRLVDKELNAEEKALFEKLKKDHEYKQQTAQDLIRAKDAFLAGEVIHIETIIEKLKALIAFYPGHIKLEEEQFFGSVEKYFNPEEKRAIEEDVQRFDQRAFHEKYRAELKNARKIRKIQGNLDEKEFEDLF